MESIWPNIFASSIVMLVFLIIAGIVFWFVSQRGMAARKDHFKQIHVNLAPGERVMFAGGLYGTVCKVGKDVVEVKTKSGAVMEVSRYSVQSIESGR